MKTDKFFVFGRFASRKELRGKQLAAGQMAMASKLCEDVARRAVRGTFKEKKLLSLITKVVSSQFWIQVHIDKSATIQQRHEIKAWLVKNNYVYTDKSYQWTRNISRHAEYIALGPWSVAPRVSAPKNYTKYELKSTTRY